MIDRPLQTFSVAFADRAFSELEYAREVARASRRRRTRNRHRRPRFLRGAAAARLARGRADRAPVERAAATSSPRWRGSTSKWCSPGKAATNCSADTAKYPACSHSTGALAAYTSGSCPRRLRDLIARAIVPRLPETLGRYARRSFLAMDRSRRGDVPRQLRRRSGSRISTGCSLRLVRRAATWPAAYAASMQYFNASERREHAARSASLYRHQDLPRRAADEAGPDEHGDVDREPRAVSRPRAGRVRRAPARRLKLRG